MLIWPGRLYGTAYWKEIVNFEALCRHGMIDKSDLDLFQFADEPAVALEILKARLAGEPPGELPVFAHSHHRLQE